MMRRSFVAPCIVLALLLLGMSGTGARQPVGSAAVFVETGRPNDPIASVLAAALQRARLEVRRATLERAAERGWWDALSDEIVALPDAVRFPAAARDRLVAFLGRGGKLI